MTETANPLTEAESSDDIIVLLRSQHEQVKHLFAAIEAASGDARRDLFDELRELLAVHETAEELVLRPMSSTDAGSQVAEDRNREEKAANEMLAELEGLDTDSVEFLQKFATFRQAVLLHAQSEESLEFPEVLRARSPQDRAAMGRRLRAAERLAPTHPHPSVAGSTGAQLAVGPFAALVDRVKDALAD